MKKVLNLIRSYKWELLTFGAIFSVLLIDCSPNYTWVNTNSDGIHYTYAAKYLVPAHKTSAPLFLLLGHVFLWLPFGTEAWRMSLISVLASTGSAVFIYLIVREKVGEKGRLYGIIGALIFGGSALVISQSTIVETYALVTMFGLGAYYFAIKKQWMWCAVMLGTGGAVHHLIGITLIVLFVSYRGLRKWRYIGVMSAFLLLYLYIPITAMVNQPINMWGNLSPQAFLRDNASTAGMLIGGLSIWDLPKRVIDAVGLLGVSLWLALVPIGYFILAKKWHSHSKWYKEPLVWLFALPVAYYATNMAPQTYVYLMPAIGFGAVAAGVGLARLPLTIRWMKWTVLACAIGVLIFNVNYLDIGRTLDPELSASAYYYEELDKVPDGEILLPQYDWEWAAIIPYNAEFDRDIIPVCLGTLPSPYYQDELKGQGIELRDYPEASLGKKSNLIAASIVELNENVWTTQMIDPKTYGVTIIPTAGNEKLFDATPPSVVPQWQWQPSNPYNTVTGAIEVEEWMWIVQSNFNCLMVVMLGVIGGVPCWIGWTVFVRKKKWTLEKGTKESNLSKIIE